MFADRPGVETASAGLAPDAEEVVDADHIHWADVIFVMERSHRAKLNRRFRDRLRGKRVVCLDTSPSGLTRGPDDYAFMQPELVALLEKKVGPHL